LLINYFAKPNQRFEFNSKFKYPFLAPYSNFKIQAKFEDGSKSKVGDLGKLSNFHSWRFWSFNAKFRVISRNQKVGEMRATVTSSALPTCSRPPWPLRHFSRMGVPPPVWHARVGAGKP
jgi:hypothetical protein